MNPRIGEKEFLERCKKIHGDVYDLSRVSYSGMRNPIEVGCPRHRKYFFINAANFIRGSGCPDCGKKRISESRQGKRTRSVTVEEFLRRSRSLHGDKYGYDRVVFLSTRERVLIFCPIHGYFPQVANSHMAGHGCQKCHLENKARHRQESHAATIIERFRALHGEKYQYPDEYKSATEKIAILCGKHGVFYQTPMDHLAGHGCPSDVYHISAAEHEIAKFIESLGYPVRMSDTTILGGKHIDILIENRNIGIEYNGLYTHRNKGSHYHYDKYMGCKERGIELISIFEDEYEKRGDQVRDILRSRLGHGIRGVGARNIEIRSIAAREAIEFCDRFHIQGSTKGGVQYGGFVGDAMVAVMVFGHPTRQRSAEFELKRFVTDGKHYPGIASKLFKRFINDHSPTSVVSFSDNRWFSGQMYEALDFKLDREYGPDYTYFHPSRGLKRFHKSAFRKQLIAKKFGKNVIDGKTESSAMVELGYFRLWDCGKKRWLWEP